MKKVLFIVGALWIQGALAASETSPTSIHCSSKSAKNPGYVIDMKSDMTQLQVIQQTKAGPVVKGELTCTKEAGGTPTAPAPGQTIVSFRCQEANKADAGYSVVIYQTGEVGVYQAELSEQTFAGPHLIDLLNCQ